MFDQEANKKIKLNTSIALMAGAFTLLSSITVAQASTTIRIASVNDSTSEAFKVVESVSERITERTDGRMQFQLFPSAQLGSTSDSLEQASQGQPVITFTSASFMATFGVPELSVVEGPFVIDDLEQGERLAFSELMRGFYDELAETANLRPLALNWFDGPRHMIGKSPYPEPSDLNNVKMRVPPVETWQKTFKPLGVIATTVEAAESYSGLAQGVVSAAESPLTGLRANRWYEVAPHITETGHFNLFTGWVISESVFRELSEDDQAIMLEEFRRGGQEITERSMAAEAEIRDEFEAAGVTFHKANLEAYREATSDFYSSFNEWPEDLYQRVRAAATGE